MTVLFILICIIILCILNTNSKNVKTFAYVDKINSKSPKILPRQPKLYSPKTILQPRRPVQKASDSSSCLDVSTSNITYPSGKICCTLPECHTYICSNGFKPNLTCPENKISKCVTIDGKTYCMCFDIEPIDGKCPDGYKLESYKYQGGACDGRLPPSCVCTAQLVSYQKNKCLKI